MKIVGQKGFGPGDFSVGLWHEALAMLCKAGFSPEMAKKIADFNSGTAEKIVGLLTEIVNSAARVESFRIVVDYSRSLPEMISAGKYDWVNSNITAGHFPVKGSGKVELVPKVVQCGQHMSSDDIVSVLNQRGLRPATLPELLAFGASYPDKQREFPIVALGSVWQSFGGVACLDSVVSSRKLELDDWGGGWDNYYRFLAFRK